MGKEPLAVPGSLLGEELEILHRWCRSAFIFLTRFPLATQPFLGGLRSFGVVGERWGLVCGSGGMVLAVASQTAIQFATCSTGVRATHHEDVHAFDALRAHVGEP